MSIITKKKATKNNSALLSAHLSVPMPNRFNLSFIGFGMGLRSSHFSCFEHALPAQIDWFEALSENYLFTYGRPRRILNLIASERPVVLHGVGLSIGGSDPLDNNYLNALGALAAQINPAWISDHLCWTGTEGRQLHDLMPVPYTQAALQHITDRIRQVQDRLGRPLILENPSSYYEYAHSTIPEAEFLAQLAEQADCGLLLDVNNVYVSCQNHGLDPDLYLRTLPADRIVQIHLAGYSEKPGYLLDTHGAAVYEPVWELYRQAIRHLGPVSTLIEWDTAIPELEVVTAEVDKARRIADEAEKHASSPPHATAVPPPSLLHANKDTRASASPDEAGPPLSELYRLIQRATLSAQGDESATPHIRQSGLLSPAERLSIYRDGYEVRMLEAVESEYPATGHLLGPDLLRALIRAYVAATPSRHVNLGRYVWPFADFLAAHTGLRAQPHLPHTQAIEMAQFERMIGMAYETPDAPTLTPERFAALPPEIFLTTRFTLQPSLALATFTHDPGPYHDAVRAGTPPAQPPTAETTHLLVLRHKDEIWRIKLEEGEYLLLHALQKGATPAEALDEAAKQCAVEELLPALPRWFHRWVRNGVFTDRLRHDETQPADRATAIV